MQVTAGYSEEPGVISAARLRALLAVLLWRANQPVPVDEIAELVWDGAPPYGAPEATRALVMRLRRRLAWPVRAAEDWSIELPGSCACELCVPLRKFLADPARRTLEWKLAKAGRQHIHSRIDTAELPVQHQTRRQGSPFTLVLTKTQALFDREHEARSRDEADLAML